MMLVDPRMERELKSRCIKGLLEFLILNHARGSGTSGYDLIKFINENFSILVNPGTVYYNLDMLVRKEYLEPVRIEGKKKIYRLTNLGRDALFFYDYMLDNVINAAKNVGMLKE